MSSSSARELGASKELTQATHAGRGAISQVAQLGVGSTAAGAGGAPNGGGGPVAGRRRFVNARNQAGSAPAGANGAAGGGGGLGVGAAEMTDPTATRRPRHM